MELKGKQIVVTGGAGGIGSLLCEALRNKGDIVGVVDRTEDNGALAADLSTLQGIVAAGQAIAEKQPDIIVNLAGLTYFGEFEKESPEHVSALMHVNLLAPMILSQAVIPGMKQRKSGMIVNIGSVFGAIPFAYFATYSTSKAGIRALSDALRRELEDTGISVVHIAPRAVKTPLNNAQVMELAAKTKMKMDAPDVVVSAIIAAMEANKPHTVIGFPEKLFVRLHGLSPTMIDGGVRKQNQAAKSILTHSH
jgi:short-subunit dehydrogenase